MIKLIKLCFVCYLIFRATFVEADYQKYEEYIKELAELEQKYRQVDEPEKDERIIVLSDSTMKQVIDQLQHILQLRADTKIGTSQEEDSHPALLKVNGVVYELYFHGTKDMPGNCRLKQQGKKGTPWLKEKNGEKRYNSELNIEENYVEQTLLFCLEIARRRVKREDTAWLEFRIPIEGSEESEEWVLPIVKDTKGQFKGLDVVGCIAWATSLNRLPDTNLFKCFEGEKRKDFLGKYLSNASIKLREAKKDFLNKKITDRIFPRTILVDFLCNKDIIEKLERQGFNKDTSVKDSNDANLILTIKEIIDKKNQNISHAENIKKVDNISKGTNSKFASSYKNNSEKGNKDSKAQNNKFSPIYVWTVSSESFSVEFFDGQGAFEETKPRRFTSKYFSPALLCITGADNITRWLYLKNPGQNSQTQAQGEICLVDVH